MTTSLIFKTFLFLHIAAGSTALLAGLIALIVKKRKGPHTKAGTVFYFSMLMVAASAFVMSIMHQNFFLFVVAVFSLYLVFTGYRSINILKRKVSYGILDFSMMILSAILMIGVTLVYLYKNPFSFTGFSSILLIFDMILARMLFNDFKVYANPDSVTKNGWLIRHIVRMIAAYIATTTAFLVVNVSYKYPIMIWLAPTVIFIPIIYYNVSKYKKKNVLK